MQNKYKLIILTFFILNLYNWVLGVEIEFGIPKIIKYLLVVFVLGVMIYYKINNPAKPEPGGLFFSVIVLFTVWSVFMLISAALKFSSLFDIQRVFGISFFYLPYALPLILLFTKFDIEFFRYFFYYTSLLIIPTIIVQLMIFATGVSAEKWMLQVGTIGIFDLGSGFLLLSAHLSNNRRITRNIIIFTVLMLILYTLYGRRGAMIEYLILMFFFILMRLMSPFSKMNDRFKIYFAGLLIIIMVLAFGYLLSSTYAFQRGFSKNALEDSRGVVFEAFFYDFRTMSDWIFGRGLDGKVLRAIGERITYTDLIENGFLTVLLKGGLLYLIPFLFILLRAVYLGLFKSNNDLVKALAYLILIYVIMMAYFNLPVFAMRYVLVWIAVSACFSREIRVLNNERIYQAINSKVH